MTFGEPVAYAGFSRRFIAAFIDALLFGVIFSIAFSPFAGGAKAEIISFISIVENLLAFAITVFFWVRLLGTPGKLLMGCQVVDADSGHPVSVKQAALRYLGYFLSFITLCVGFFWIIWDKRKQGLHDKIANTVVLQNAHILVSDESQKTLQQLVSEIR